ncbi:family 1 glycosylhydrolase [Amycolatopsis azurea]
MGADTLSAHHGSMRRFSLVHVDFETQERALKDSARFYADVVARNGP